MVLSFWPILLSKALEQAFIQWRLHNQYIEYRDIQEARFIGKGGWDISKYSEWVCKWRRRKVISIRWRWSWWCEKRGNSKGQVKDNKNKE
jgi:hypothetical protein